MRRHRPGARTKHSLTRTNELCESIDTKLKVVVVVATTQDDDADLLIYPRRAGPTKWRRRCAFSGNVHCVRGDLFARESGGGGGRFCRCALLSDYEYVFGRVRLRLTAAEAAIEKCV